MKWSGMPNPTEMQIEEEVASLVLSIVNFKKRNNSPGAQWKVGTTGNFSHLLQVWECCQPLAGASSWHEGTPKRAAQEIADYHGMEIEGRLNLTDTYIYAYTDSFPTREERRRREKEPLTVKQKRAFRAISQYIARNGRGPTKTELARILGHRSLKTTTGFLDILDKKNWIMVEDGRRRIELL